MAAMSETIPSNESARMAAVRRYDILDSPRDGAFDRVTAIAARRFNVPISIISIVDHDRIWFKSHYGLDVPQIDREPGLCGSAILSNDPWILTDAKIDIRSLANPLVAGDFGLRFYLGIPLTTHDGFNLGTLCVIDHEPRTVEESQIADLKDLASLVVDQLELRLAARQTVQKSVVLSHETDHRVMNSLQFVISMLQFQARQSNNPAVADHLKIAAHRVQTVSRVHRHFYVANTTDRVEGFGFLKRLCDELAEVMEADILVQGTEAHLPSGQIQPVGMIVNELVTNAAKYGKGQIVVDFNPSIDGAEICLSVSDNGPGLPQGFDPKSAGTGLGMKVVHILADQMSGQFVAGANVFGQGSTFRISWPASHSRSEAV